MSFKDTRFQRELDRFQKGSPDAFLRFKRMDVVLQRAIATVPVGGHVVLSGSEINAATGYKRTTGSGWSNAAKCLHQIGLATTYKARYVKTGAGPGLELTRLA